MHINTQTLTNFCPRSTTCIHGLILLNTRLHLLFGFYSFCQRHLILMAEAWVVPAHPVIVANEGLFIRIPDPKHVMSSWWWLEPGKSGKADITPTNHPVDLRQELVLPKPSRPKPTIHPAFPSVSPAAQSFWKCPFWMGKVWTYAYILHHIINTYHKNWIVT